MEQETHVGIVSRIFAQYPDRPWMSGVLRKTDGSEVRFAGKIWANVGDRLEIVGAWTKHPKFGKQLYVATGSVGMDDSPDALKHLLATHDAFKGIGPARADKIVDAALSLSESGDIAEALITYPEQIADRAGVKRELVVAASEIWGERKEFFDALALVCEQGWSAAQGKRIVDRLGTNAAAVVRSDPYFLIGKIPRFGFRTVDTIARKLGVTSTDPARLLSGILYTLDRIASDGHTWDSRSGLVDRALIELEPDTLDGEAKIRESVEKLIAEGALHVDVAPSGGEVISDARLARVEIESFRKLMRGLGDDTLGELAIPAGGVFETLNDAQAAAVRGMALHRFNVLSGGAGVGKTYTVSAVCEMADANGLRVELCAPTGKAALKLERSSGREARTVHRMLEPMHDGAEFKFTRHAGNPLEADLVIVDEVSMVDVRLMRSLLSALPAGCRLLLVGDHNQIPSVGPGAILRDLLAAESRYPDAVHRLTDIVRQAGTLARNTTAILSGIVVRSPDPAWRIVSTEEGDAEGAAAMVAQTVDQLVAGIHDVLPANRFLDMMWDVQVLAPQRKGELGTYALNVKLQELRRRMLGLSPPEPTPEGRSPKPLVGDRIIWTENDYTLDLMNGTQARVVNLPKGGAMEIELDDGREVTIPANKRDRVDVAWAITMHKAQGSEWPYVVLVASGKHWYMHDRNLLYTGAGRASECLVIVGDTRGMRHFAKEQKSAARQTFGGLFAYGWDTKLLDTQDVVEADVENPTAEETTS